ncbi:MAG: DUF1844 domain-containing protein [Thermoanaerobaculia bacterium]
MSEKEIKVTDKRMFTADGELREDYRQAEEDQEPEHGGPGQEPVEEPQPEPTPPPESTPGFEPTESSAERGEPTFFDLVSVIAEPISLYLGDSTLADGGSMENLEIARLYIDLLEVLRQKTVGNLDPEEQKFLDELLYRIRMRYVQKNG